MKSPKSQKPSEFKGEISKNRKNPHNLKDFFEKCSSRGDQGGRKSLKDGPADPSRDEIFLQKSFKL